MQKFTNKFGVAGLTLPIPSTWLNEKIFSQVLDALNESGGLSQIDIQDCELGIRFSDHKAHQF